MHWLCHGHCYPHAYLAGGYSSERSVRSDQRGSRALILSFLSQRKCASLDAGQGGRESMRLWSTLKLSRTRRMRMALWHPSTRRKLSHCGIVSSTAAPRIRMFVVRAELRVICSVRGYISCDASQLRRIPERSVIPLPRQNPGADPLAIHSSSA